MPTWFMDTPLKGFWTYWLEWKIETEAENYLRRSKRRFCLFDINEKCLFEEKIEEECFLNDCKNTVLEHCYHNELN